MINITVVAVGNLKEKFSKDAQNEYLKRLSAFCKVKIIETKEVRLSMTIDEHDIAYRISSATKFLKEGNKVKVSLRMKGREQAYVKKAIEVVKDFCARLDEFGTLDKEPELLGRNVFVVISPKKTK